MKKFFAEFKKFITRGNVLDMAVGVIVGGAFTAIVNSLSNNILKPIINFLLALVFGADSLSEIFTFLKRVEIVNDAGVTEVDLANSIYIDWGTFIGAIINFLIVAFALFCIVKLINRVRDQQSKFKKTVHGNIAKEDVVAMRKAGIKLKDKEAVDAYFAEKAKKEAAAKAAAEEAARLAREANPTTEDLLKLILAELKSK
jgi:large conductance mechanosensitive channel